MESLSNPTNVSSSFTVRGNQVLDPSGTPVKFKGVVQFAYLLSASPELQSYRLYRDLTWDNGHKEAFLSQASALGMNMVRVGVGPGIACYPDQLQLLDEVVSLITTRGMVIVLDNDGGTFEENKPWLGYLGLRYKNNPYVWLLPANEINCNTNRSLNLARGLPPLVKQYCGDTEKGRVEALGVWRHQTNAYISSIREAGFQNPIVIHGIGYSGDLSLISSEFPWITRMRNIVFGVHLYPFNDVDHVITEDEKNLLNQRFANLSATLPILIDEYGNGLHGCDKGFATTWASGLIDFAKDWIHSRGGVGLLGFYFTGRSFEPGSWEDFHYMVDPEGNFTPWGTLFATRFLSPGATLPPGTRSVGSILGGLPHAFSGDFDGSGSSALLVPARGMVFAVRFKDTKISEVKPLTDVHGEPYPLDLNAYRPLGIGRIEPSGTQLLLGSGNGIHVVQLRYGQVVAGYDLIDARTGNAFILPPSTQALGLGDVLGTGTPQVLLRDPSGALSLLKIEGAKASAILPLTDPSGAPYQVNDSQYKILGLANVSGDSRAELILAGGGSFQAIGFNGTRLVYGMSLKDAGSQPLRTGTGCVLPPANYSGRSKADLLVTDSGKVTMYSLIDEVRASSSVAGDLNAP